MCFSTGPLTLQDLLGTTFPVAGRLNRETKEWVHYYLDNFGPSVKRLRRKGSKCIRSPYSGLSSSDSKGGRLG